MPPARSRHATPRAHSRKRRSEAPRTRLDVDERRAQLVELGLEHFGAAPYDDVSIDAIAQAAGISKGLLYHYFPTKRAFYAASIREAATRLLDACDVQRERRGKPRTLEDLDLALDAYLSYVRAHGRAYATLMRSGVGVDREIARIVDETRQAFVDKLTEGLPRAAATPLVRIALRGWVGFAEATSLGWIDAIAAHPKSAPSQDDVRRVLAHALVDLVQRAVSGATTAS